MSRRVRIWGHLLLVLLAVGGCRGGEGGANGAAAPTTPGPSATDGAATEPAGGEEEAEIEVVLGGDRLVVGGNALVYGAPDRQVRSYLGRVLGDPTASTEEACDAGVLQVHRWPALTAYVAEGGFAGWDAGDDTFATEAGVRLGSARGDVEAAYPTVTVTESSLGTEFFVPVGDAGTGISGLFGDDAKVEALWSGATCVAR